MDLIAGVLVEFLVDCVFEWFLWEFLPRVFLRFMR